MRPHRNITKSIQHKYVRPMRRKDIQLKVNPSLLSNKEVNKIEETSKVEDIKEINVIEEKVENKEKITKEDMNTIDVNQVDAMLQAEEAKLPKRKVKVEKKDKGLFERTENSRVILTEDNKMLLND